MHSASALQAPAARERECFLAPVVELLSALLDDKSLLSQEDLQADATLCEKDHNLASRILTKTLQMCCSFSLDSF